MHRFVHELWSISVCAAWKQSNGQPSWSQETHPCRLRWRWWLRLPVEGSRRRCQDSDRSRRVQQTVEFHRSRRSGWSSVACRCAESLLHGSVTSSPYHDYWCNLTEMPLQFLVEPHVLTPSAMQKFVHQSYVWTEVSHSTISYRHYVTK